MPLLMQLALMVSIIAYMVREPGDSLVAKAVRFGLDVGSVCTSQSLRKVQTIELVLGPRLSPGYGTGDHIVSCPLGSRSRRGTRALGWSVC